MAPCAFSSCKNNPQKGSARAGVSYFRFPSDPLKCAEWTSIVARERRDNSYKPTPHSVICSDHFNKSEISRKTLRHRLDKTAVPKLQIMDNEEHKKYIIIKVLSKNLSNIENYACIPSSWIKAKDDTNKNNVIIGYPLEDTAQTLIRVIEYQLLDNTWPLLYAEIVCDTDSREEAFRLCRLKNEEHEKELKGLNCAASINHDAPKIKTTEKRKLPTQVTASHDKFKIADDMGNVTKGIESEIAKLNHFISVVTEDNNQENAVSSTSNTLQNNQGEESNEKLPKEIDSDSIATRSVNIKHAGKKIHGKSSAYLKKRRPLNYKDTDNEDDSNDPDYACSSDDDDSLASTSLPRKVELKRHQRASVVSKNVSISDDFETEVSLDERHIYDKYKSSLEGTISFLDGTLDSLQRLINIHKNKTSKPTQPQSESQGDDAKWTLRNPEPGRGLVELMPDSGVFVSNKVLRHLQRKPKYFSTYKLATGLLEEVFKEEALQVCSFTGSEPRRGKMWIKRRPGLDLNARETLIAYVQQYGTERGWRNTEYRLIQSCLQNKLQRCHLN